VGSTNLTPGSFEERRELAIELIDDEILDRLQSVVDQDWQNSTPLHVSDEGITADFHHQEAIVSRWRSSYGEPD
jgi:phosphatidylserine/phosphatidylglycerophosphate/cardiolipin synthase-like enzyme